MSETVHRTCLICQHLDINLGESDWSELTPGESASAKCLKNHWSISQNEGIVTERMRTNAINCKDFQLHSSIKVKGDTK